MPDADASGGASREGGCACGEVRYRVTGDPIMVHNCHCCQCQQQTGSTSVVNAFWESDRVEILGGVLEECALPGGSGKPQVILRCSDCGIVVLSHYGGLGELMSSIRVGTLDDPSSVTPDVVIFTSEAMPWVALPQGIPHFAHYYDFREVLPQDRQDRLMALVAQRKAKEG